MKLRLVVLFVLTWSMAGQASAAVDWCSVFAKTRDSLNPVSIIGTKNFSKLTEVQVKMIQLSVLVNDVHYESRPLNLEDTIAIFNDTYNGRDGSLGGDISFYEVKAPGAKTKKIALVTYFPGDNEYGAVFAMNSYADGHETASFIGSVGDSDIACLKN
ncbi:MAG: hypothetical protein NTV34_14875 [Proteobacteria bacterium]|nr:hypothetical protein [Pseudomonadota bacterium]